MLELLGAEISIKRAAEKMGRSDKTLYGRNKTPLRGATSSELDAYTFPNEQALYWSLLVYIIDRNVDCIYHAENFPGFVFPSS